LKVAHCGDVSCSTGNILSVVDPTVAGLYSSITIGTDGLPVISYYDQAHRNLKVAHCGDVTCSSGNSLVTLDSTNSVGEFTSITIGGDGLPVISYLDRTNYNLKVAHCGEVTCNTHTLVSVDSSGSVSVYGTSITIGNDGLPLISYYTNNNTYLKVAHCGNFACSAGNTIATVNSGGSTMGGYNAITIGSDGLPLLSFFDATKVKKFAVIHCGNETCSADNTLSPLDFSAFSAYYHSISITIGVDGLPVISYFDNIHNNLKVAHCSNVFCIPYWRRR